MPVGLFGLATKTIRVRGVTAAIIASMSAGWATPTESAAIGAFATVVLALAYRALTAAKLIAALRGTVGISGMILFIIVGATTFSQILSFSGASSGLVSLITGQGLSPMVVIVSTELSVK